MFVYLKESKEKTEKHLLHVAVNKLESLPDRK